VTFAVASAAARSPAPRPHQCSGIATVGSWTLGATAGSNTLTATSGTLTGSPVTFTATGTAGTATTIALKLGDGQSATVGTDVAILPSVLVTDGTNPVSGVSVTFAVASGGGSVTGASATTNASGIATVGSWTLGATPARNTLTATSGTLTGSPVTFTATGTAGTATTIALKLGDASPPPWARTWPSCRASSSPTEPTRSRRQRDLRRRLRRRLGHRRLGHHQMPPASPRSAAGPWARPPARTP